MASPPHVSELVAAKAASLPAAAKALNKAAPAPIGLTPAGAPVYAPFQPSVASLAALLTPFLRTAVGLDRALPLPAGLELIRAPDDSQTQLKPSSFFDSKNRRIFGYVAEIKLSSGEGANTPAQLQVVCRIPWRYGVTSADCSKPTPFFLLLASGGCSLVGEILVGSSSECRHLLRKPCFPQLIGLSNWALACLDSASPLVVTRRAVRWWGGTCSSQLIRSCYRRPLSRPEWISTWTRFSRSLS